VPLVCHRAEYPVAVLCDTSAFSLHSEEWHGTTKQDGSYSCKAVLCKMNISGASDRKCSKCGGTSEYRIRLEKLDNNNKLGRYEIFECVDCGSFEWWSSVQKLRNRGA